MVRRNIAWGRINFSIVSVTIALVSAASFGSRLDNDPDTIGVIVTVFSILAGVLIAVISILGDPSMIMDQSWRNSYVKSEEVQRKLHRNTDIFILYVLLMAVSIIFMIIDESDILYVWIQRSLFFLIVLSFLASLSLPYSLKSIQRQRLNDAIASMKKPTNGS